MALTDVVVWTTFMSLNFCGMILNLTGKGILKDICTANTYVFMLRCLKLLDIPYIFFVGLRTSMMLSVLMFMMSGETFGLYHVADKLNFLIFNGRPETCITNT